MPGRSVAGPFNYAPIPACLLGIRGKPVYWL